jgi:hypothetical protein
MVAPEPTPDTTAGNIEWVPISKIRTDHEVNTRPIDFGWVDKHVNTFDPDKLGVPIVSMRPDGTYVVIDGQNRLEICRRVGWGDQDIQCRVFRGLTKAQEAVLFLGHNDNRQVGSFHKFAARITAGDPDAVAINNIVIKAGWELSYFVADKRIAAVSSLEAIWKATRPDPTGYRGTTLETTLSIATEAWGHSADAANGQLLRGIGAVVNRYGTLLDTAALTRKLAQHRGGAMGLLADGRGLQNFAGGTVGSCVAETIVRIYNSHRRAGALPAWRQDRGSD